MPKEGLYYNVRFKSSSNHEWSYLMVVGSPLDLKDWMLDIAKQGNMVETGRYYLDAEGKEVGHHG